MDDVAQCYYVLPHLFFFNDTATTEIYTLSLHDALPISPRNCFWATRWWKKRPGDETSAGHSQGKSAGSDHEFVHPRRSARDRKSTRLNSSHGYISYAVFCLKKNREVNG